MVSKSGSQIISVNCNVFSPVLQYEWASYYMENFIDLVIYLHDFCFSHILTLVKDLKSNQGTSLHLPFGILVSGISIELKL